MALELGGNFVVGLGASSDSSLVIVVVHEVMVKFGGGVSSDSVSFNVTTFSPFVFCSFFSSSRLVGDAWSRQRLANGLIGNGCGLLSMVVEGSLGGGEEGQ